MRFDKLAHEEDRQKEMVTGELTALVDGKEIDRPRPAKWFFHNHESEPTTEVAIKRAPAEDLYITLGNYDLAEGTATLKLVVNPVVDWIWFGFMLLAIGDRHRAGPGQRARTADRGRDRDRGGGRAIGGGRGWHRAVARARRRQR